MYWSTINFIKDDYLSNSFLKPLNTKIYKFLKILKKNKLHFIEKEYVVFYELDITTIYGMNNNVHKSKKWLKYFNKYARNVYKNTFIFNIIYKNKKKFFFFYNYLIYFLKKNTKKIKIKKNFWKEINSYNLITFHHKFKKLKIISKNFNKITFSLTPGMTLKKLGIEGKKNKKLYKIFYIMIKSVFKTLETPSYLYKYVIQFKGVNNFIYKYINYINQYGFNFSEVYFIYTPVIPNKFKFKKIRSLKKNFRKNFLKSM